jgi:hypothetical protein
VPGHLLLLALSLAAANGAPASVDVSGIARVAGRPIEHAVIWIDVGPMGRTGLRPRVAVGRAPARVLAVEVGTPVALPEAELVFQSVFSSPDGGSEDLGLYPIGPMRHVRSDRPSLNAVRSSADAPQSTYVVVVDTPYFAVSDDTGGFRIAGVPAGRYPYHAWRPGGAVLTDTITIEPGRAFEVRWP